MVVIEIESGDVSLFNATDHVGSTERLKDLISDLRPSEVYAVTRYVLFLRHISDPFSRSSDEAPLDDEDFPPDDDDDDWDDDDSPQRWYTQEEIDRELGL